MDNLAFYFKALCRDVVALLKSKGAHLYEALSLKKTGGAQSTLYLNLAKKLGGPGPPGPLGHYIPALRYIEHLKLLMCSFKKMKHPKVDEDHERPLYATFEKVISTDDSEKKTNV